MHVKKEFLRRVKPGAITAFKPKFVWVQMPCYNVTVSNKFNGMMAHILETKDSHYIIKTAEVLDDAGYFSRDRLNGNGIIQFWSELNYQLEMFNNQKISLKPLELQPEDDESKNKMKTVQHVSSPQQQCKRRKQKYNKSHFWFLSKRNPKGKFQSLCLEIKSC